VAVDCDRRVLQDHPQVFRGAAPICAAGAAICPLPDGSFDLVFCQFALLWMDAVPAVRGDSPHLAAGRRAGGHRARLRRPDRASAGIATRGLWLAALRRAGADPLTGRKLPGWLSGAGFDVRADLLDHLGAGLAAAFRPACADCR